MIAAVKRNALAAARGLGVFSMVRESRWRAERLAILCYHGVSMVDEHLWRPSLYVSADALEQRLQLLADGGYSVLPLDDAIARLYAGDLPPKSVALTFDDGAHDFYAKAVPVLEKFGFPATVYLTTYYCEPNRPVFTVYLAYVLWQGRDTTWDASALLGREARFDLRTERGRADAHDAVMQYTEDRTLSGAAKDTLVSEIARQVGAPDARNREMRVLHLMTPAEVAELSRKNIHFELHTHRHRAPQDRTAFLRELDDNGERIVRFTLGKAPVHFCYPSGVYRPEFVRWLRERGVRSATTCDSGIATRSSAPLLLPRIVDTSTLDVLEFEGWVSGARALLPARRAEGAYRG